MNDNVDIGKMKEIAEKYGFTDAEFTSEPFGDLKVKWVRSFKTIKVQLPDYLDEAPAEVVYGLLNNIFSRIAGTPVPDDDTCTRYYLSREFRDRNADTYIARKTHVPKAEELETLARVRRMAAGIPEDVRFAFGDVETDMPWYGSMMFKTVILDSSLKDMPAEDLAKAMELASQQVQVMRDAYPDRLPEDVMDGYAEEFRRYRGEDE